MVPAGFPTRPGTLDFVQVSNSGFREISVNSHGSILLHAMEENGKYETVDYGKLGGGHIEEFIENGNLFSLAVCAQ
jgi:hypothetical protein